MTIRALFLKSLVLLSAIFFLSVDNRARAVPQFRNGQIIMDAEISWIMRQFLAPIYQVARLKVRHPLIFLIVDPELNAFATPGPAIFVHTGLLLDVESASELLGVLSHETGHVAHHHITRRIQAYEQAQKHSMIAGGLGLLLGGLAGSGEGAIAGLYGGMDAVHKNMLHFTRGQEASADQAALSYLDQLQWSAEGMRSFFKKLEKQELLPASRQSKFLRTHPLSQERMQYVEQHVKDSPYKGKKLPQAYEDYLYRLQAKIYAYLEPLDKVQKKYPKTDNSVPARYAHAIVAYRRGLMTEAMNTIEALIKDYPEDPFYLDFKGVLQMEMKSYDLAIMTYEKALGLLPKEPFYYLALAQLYLEKKDDQESLAKAHSYAYKAIEEDPSPIAWYYVAIVEGKRGCLGKAALALSEKALLEWNFDLAKSQAKRAESLLPKKDKAHHRIRDILEQIETQKNKKES